MNVNRRLFIKNSILLSLGGLIHTPQLKEKNTLTISPQLQQLYELWLKSENKIYWVVSDKWYLISNEFVLGNYRTFGDNLYKSGYFPFTTIDELGCVQSISLLKDYTNNSHVKSTIVFCSREKFIELNKPKNPIPIHILKDYSLIIT